MSTRRLRKIERMLMHMHQHHHEDVEHDHEAGDEFDPMHDFKPEIRTLMGNEDESEAETE